MLQQGGKKYAGADERACDMPGQAHKADRAPIHKSLGKNKGLAGADGYPRGPAVAHGAGIQKSPPCGRACAADDPPETTTTSCFAAS